MYLFLDDERMPGDVTWVEIPNVIYHIVRSYDEFVHFLSNNPMPEFITFDHDLADQHYVACMQEQYVLGSMGGGDDNRYFIDDGDLPKTFDYGPEKTGYDCAKWLVEQCVNTETPFPKYQVHSMNPIGAKRIRDYINWAKERFGI